MHSLPLFHRIAGTQVVVVGNGEMAVAKRRLIERAGGICVGEAEAHLARLGFVALEDRSAAEMAALRLKRRGLVVNVADRPELCDFTLPSILERGDVLVAVSTGGASAGLAKQLRLRLETILPSSLAALADALKRLREQLRVRWPDPVERRYALDAALSVGGALDPFDPAAAERASGWLDRPETSPPPRTVEIALTSDDPDDLTLRQAKLLGMADTIVHDADAPAAILARARADAVRTTCDDPNRPDGGMVVVLRRSGSR